MTETALPVPSSISKVTADWLRSALADTLPAAEPAVPPWPPVGVGFGLASTLVRCALRGPDTPRSVIVKLWSTDGLGGANEVPFYADFAPRLGIRVPRCYHGAIDADRRRAVLVLEDFDASAQGDCLLRLDAAGSAALARLLATVHARWSSSPALDEATWLPSLRVVREPEWVTTRREGVRSRFGDRIGPALALVLERADEAQTRIRERLGTAAATLVHGDLHLDNVIFLGAAKEPLLLDWSRVARGPAATDLAELLFAMTPPDGWEAALRAYLIESTRLGYECDRASLEAQLGGALLRMALRSTLGVAAWEPSSDRERAILEVGLRRVEEALAAWRSVDAALLRL